MRPLLRHPYTPRTHRPWIRKRLRLSPLGFEMLRNSAALTIQLRDKISGEGKAGRTDARADARSGCGVNRTEPLAQQAAYDTIADAIRAKQYRTFLLHGVTGSGKTEIYLNAIEAALAESNGRVEMIAVYAAPAAFARERTRRCVYTTNGLVLFSEAA